MTTEPSPYPHDYSYAEQVAGAARHDIANALLSVHLAECEACAEAPFGFCDLALKMISNPPALKPSTN